MKVCLATCVHYEKYLNQFKIKLLRSYLESNIPFPLYVDTNMSHAVGKHPNVHVFDTSSLQDPQSRILEELPLSPPYYNHYKWNLRRFIIKRAAQDGYNIILYSDVDAILLSDNLEERVMAEYKENCFKSASYIWEYQQVPENSVFRHFWQYQADFPHWGLTTHNLKAIDGPTNYYFGKSTSDIIQLINRWSEIVYATYNLNYGDRNFFIENQSMALNSLRWSIEPSDHFHRIEHDIHNRY